MRTPRRRGYCADVVKPTVKLRKSNVLAVIFVAVVLQLYACGGVIVELASVSLSPDGSCSTRLADKEFALDGIYGDFAVGAGKGGRWFEGGGNF